MKFTEEYVMCMEKHVLAKKMFSNWLNIFFSLQAQVEKIVHGVKIYWLSSKENTALSKEGHADSLLGHERTYHYWFPIADSSGKISLMYWITFIATDC